MDIVKVSLSGVKVDLSGVKVRFGSAKENGGLVQLVQKFTGLLAHTHVRTYAFYIIVHVVISRFLIRSIRAFDKFLFHPYSPPARFSASVSARLKRWRFLCPSLQPFAGIQSV